MAFDDCPQHSKSHRQIASILPKIPSRDAPPPDIPNVHPSLLERPGKSKYSTKGGPITGFPATETINPDTTDHIATNTTPTTDGQPHSDKKPPPDPIRPSFESGLSVSRIGSAAQSKRTKTVPGGTKNTITHSRKETQSNSNQRLFHSLHPSNIIPCSNHSFINPIELSLIPSIVNKTSPISSSLISRPQTEYSSCNLSSSSYHALLLSKISPNPSPPYPIPFLIDYFYLRYFLYQVLTIHGHRHHSYCIISYPRSFIQLRYRHCLSTAPFIAMIIYPILPIQGSKYPSTAYYCCWRIY
jgi:hypothetical protein